MPDTATMLALTIPPRNKGSHAARRLEDPTLTTIVEVVAKDFGLRPEQLLKKTNKRIYAFPRFTVSWLARSLTTQSYPMIARKLGYDDHTSPLYGKRKVDHWAATRPDIKERLEQLAEECRRRTP